MIILEGPDGVGKTTLAQQLTERAGQLRTHHEGLPAPSERALLQRYAGLLLDDTADVYDRLHVGECVYGNIIRKRDLLGSLGFQLLDRLIASLDGTVIYCMVPYKLAKANWLARHNQEYVAREEKYRQIYDAYAKIMQIPQQSLTLTYDYTRHGLGQVDDVINRRPFRSPKGCLGVIGTAKVLMVGEVANHRTLDLPFFSTGGSSQYLHEILKDAGWLPHELMLTNAKTLDHGKSRDLFTIWLATHCVPVIALGRAAEAILQRQQVPVAYTFSHPAYWKRFHVARRDKYVAQFRDARAAILGLPN